MSYGNWTPSTTPPVKPPLKPPETNPNPYQGVTWDFSGGNTGTTTSPAASTTTNPPYGTFLGFKDVGYGYVVPQYADGKGGSFDGEPVLNQSQETGTTQTKSKPEGAPNTVWGDDGYEYSWDPYTGNYNIPTGNYDPNKDQELQYNTKNQTMQSNYYQQQGSSDAATLAWQQQNAAAQAAAEAKKYEAQLAANPKSWLEYAAYMGTTPQIQPWMLPLSMGDYGWYAGMNMPSWDPKNMSTLPELLKPSMQYYNRLSPSSQQQYYGYQQARTGGQPEDFAWQQASQAPPSGSNQNLYYTK